MTSSITELRLSMARADEVFITEDTLTAELEDGRTISVPVVWYPRLSYGTQKERENWCLIGKGGGIHWPDLDEHISIENLLVGSPSGESRRSLQKWLDGRDAHKNMDDETLAQSLKGKTFWDCVYELREKDLIPRTWKRADLRPYLDVAQGGVFATNTVTTVPSNHSMTRDGKEKGDYVKKGQNARAWRLGSGVFELVNDPDAVNAEIA